LEEAGRTRAYVPGFGSILKDYFSAFVGEEDSRIQSFTTDPPQYDLLDLRGRHGQTQTIFFVI
jgi:hypothetical protein